MKFAYRCGLRGIPYRNYLKCIPDLSDHVESEPGLFGIWNIPGIPELIPRTNCWGVYPVPGLKRLLWTNILSERLNCRSVVSEIFLQSRKSKNWNLPNFRSDLPHLTLSNIVWPVWPGFCCKESISWHTKTFPVFPISPVFHKHVIEHLVSGFILVTVYIPGYSITCMQTVEGE